jgi:hypothetical protein
MEGSVLSFLKAEWKVSDTGSAHWASSFVLFSNLLESGLNYNWFFNVFCVTSRYLLHIGIMLLFDVSNTGQVWSHFEGKIWPCKCPFKYCL